MNFPSVYGGDAPRERSGGAWTGPTTHMCFSSRPHGESGAILEVLTHEHGRHLGLVRGGNSRRLRPLLQPGNGVRVEWRARLSEHLGSFVVELAASRAGQIMETGDALIRA